MAKGLVAFSSATPVVAFLVTVLAATAVALTRHFTRSAHRAHRPAETVIVGDGSPRVSAPAAIVLLRIEGLSEVDEALAIGRRLLAAADEVPFVVDGSPVAVDWSVGAALVREGETADFGEVLRQAHVASAGTVEYGSRVAVRDGTGHSLRTARPTTLSELRAALDSGQFSLVYQPKAQARDGSLIGVEALARWDHPVCGSMAPDTFVPLLERSGLSRRFTVMVLRTALAQVQQWRLNGHDMTLAVNMTARDVSDSDFPLAVERVLSEFVGAASWLHLEITESASVVGQSSAMEGLQRLAALGVSLSVDDFGAGATSLAWLRSLPIREVKLDKSYVAAMADSYVDTAIVRAVVDFAHSLRLRVVAEGVEDASTWRELARMDCDAVQGYALCPPKTAEDLSSWLARYVGDRDTGYGPRVIRHAASV